MKAALTGQIDQRRVRVLNRPAIEIQIDQPAAGHGKTLVIAPQLTVEAPGHTDAVAFGSQPQPALFAGATPGSNLEQPIAIGLPVDRFQQLVLHRLAVTLLYRLLLMPRPQV